MIRLCASRLRLAPKEITYDNIYLDTRRDQPDGHRLWIRGPVRAAHREKVRWLDWALSGQHGGNERDRLPVAISSFHAVACVRNHVAGSVGCCHRSALYQSSRWRVAVDLRGERDGCALFERFRPGGAGLREGAGPEGDCSDTIRAAVLDLPACCYGALHRAFYFGSEKVPHPAARLPL